MLTLLILSENLKLLNEGKSGGRLLLWLFLVFSELDTRAPDIQNNQ